jgi:hypothetical protein
MQPRTRSKVAARNDVDKAEQVAIAALRKLAGEYRNAAHLTPVGQSAFLEGAKKVDAMADQLLS